MKITQPPLMQQKSPHPYSKSMTVGLIAHTGKEGAAQAVKLVVEELQRKEISFLIEKKTASLIGSSSNLSETALAKQSDILLVMGGDGSILRALHQTVHSLKPIFGLNIGSLGFLTCLNAQDYKRAIQCLAEESYVLSYRSLLEVTISNKWKKNKYLDVQKHSS